VLPLSPYSICNGPWHPLYSTYVLDSPHVQPLSRSSLVFPWVMNPQLHAPYIVLDWHSRVWVLIAAVTLSGNSLRQTVHTHCASVHQAAKLVAALLRVATVTAGLVESNGSLPPGL